MNMYYLLSGIVILSALTMLPEQAHAFDIRMNCDLRILQLSDEQQNQIRARRQQYKAEQNQIRQNKNRAAQSNLRHFFAKLTFDNQQAGQIAKQRYADDMRLTVAELNFYHDIFQLLNSTQQEIWLKQCLPSGTI